MVRAVPSIIKLYLEIKLIQINILLASNSVQYNNIYLYIVHCCTLFPSFDIWLPLDYWDIGNDVYLYLKYVYIRPKYLELSKK